MLLPANNLWHFRVVLHPAHMCLLFLELLPKTIAKSQLKASPRITHLTCCAFVIDHSVTFWSCFFFTCFQEILKLANEGPVLSASTYGHLLALLPAQAWPSLSKFISSKDSYLAVPIAASILPLAGGRCSKDAELWHVLWFTRFRGCVGGPSGDFPIGPPIPIMKRFTSSVCFNFLLLLLKVSFSLFVCSRQLVLKIWKVSDLYLYQVVQHKSLIYLATSTIQTNIAKFYDEIKWTASEDPRFNRTS